MYYITANINLTIFFFQTFVQKKIAKITISFPRLKELSASPKVQTAFSISEKDMLSNRIGR